MCIENLIDKGSKKQSNSEQFLLLRVPGTDDRIFRKANRLQNNIAAFLDPPKGNIQPVIMKSSYSSLVAKSSPNPRMKTVLTS